MMSDVSDLSASHSCDKSKKLMEKSIINAIEHIRMKHRRPSSEEIFYELKKENDMLSIDVFKDSLRKLEKKFIIVNKGKNNIESYFVNDLEINDTSYGESTDITINSSALDNIGMDILVEEGLEGLEGIGSEKGKAVEISMILESGDILRNGLRKEDCENRQCENEFYALKYMNSLEQEVRFLREEIKNKNKIIELLVQDTVKRDEKFSLSHYNSTNNQDEFISPKTSVKAKNQDISKDIC